MFSVTEQNAVGRAVREARLARGVTLRSLAGSLGVSPATMSAVEHGRTPLTVERLHEIARLLDVPANRLLAGVAVPATLAAPAAPGGWRDFSTVTMDPVLEAAARLFVRQGFHATSVREVAAEAGLSVAGVYHHYPSKQALLVAMLDVTMGELLWRLEAARHDGRTPAESFGLMVEALALFHAVRGDLAFLGASEMRGLTGSELERVVGLRNEVQYALDEQARTAIDAGDFDCPDPHTACRAIATMCTALPGWFRLGGALGPEDVARDYASYALAIMRGSARDVITDVAPAPRS